MNHLLKSRWFWFVLLSVVVLLIAVPLAYQFRQRSHPLREKFDRVHFRMTFEDVKDILGEPGYHYLQEYQPPIDSVEILRLENGKWVAKRNLAAAQITQFQMRMWAYDHATIAIGLNKQERVQIKIFESRRWPTFWDQFKEWLRLP